MFMYMRPVCSLKYYISKIMVWFANGNFVKNITATRKEKINRKINLI